MTNYRRGFQRLFAALTVIWIGGVLVWAPPERVKFWNVDQVTQVQELMFDPKFQQLGPSAQKDALAQIDPRFAQISEEAYLPFRERMNELGPPGHVRLRQFLWIAALIGLLPVVTFIIAFHLAPWIYRGFR